MRNYGFFLLLLLPLHTWSQTTSSEGSSWTRAQQAKKGSIIIYWYETQPFIWNEAGQIAGIESEILEGFRKYVETHYHIDLTLVWKEGESFEGTYRTVQHEKNQGVFGASTFSITSERQEEVGFTPPYMADITVLVSSKNIPIVKDAEEFDRIFSNLHAISIKGTTIENDLLSLQKDHHIDFKIEYKANADNVLLAIQNTDNVFAYVSLPLYLVALNNNSGLTLTRQNLYPVKREGYAFIYPKGSDWNKPMQEYFASPEFQSLSKKIIDRYFKNNVYEFIENLFYHANEVMLLTREKEIQQRDLQNKSEQIKQDSVLRNFLIAGMIIFLGFLVVILALYNKGRRANNALRQQKEKIDRQRLELEKKNEELTYLNDEKNSLIKILAHDLRTPINQVRGLTEIFLSENKSLQPEKVEPINKIIDTTIRLNAMIGKILDVEAIEGKRVNMAFEPVDLSALLKKAVSSFEEMARQKNIKIEFQVPHEGLMINGDSIFLSEIIENLLSNALKFSNPGKNVFASAIDTNTTIKICVKDEGPGLTKDDKEKLFQKFQRLSAKPTAGEHSTGLGLSIIKKYTELMNGRVWCESDVGKGAAFYVEFPKSIS